MYNFFKEMTIINRFVRGIFPQVEEVLQQWRNYGGQIPNRILREQALASIKNKGFHCQGGSVFALYPGVDQRNMVEFIVAFQTISDYLDNLCDEVGYKAEKSFRQLHRALEEAIRPDLSLSDYYAAYPHQGDGGYLKALVERCRSCLVSFPYFTMVQDEMRYLVSLYCDLQSLKHLDKDIRERKIILWANSGLNEFPGLSPWEFGAATGSTLGVFVLLASAAGQDNLNKKKSQLVKEAYFPYVTGLHILLDYFIDQEEDQKAGELNFVSYYHNQGEMQEKLSCFLEKARKSAATLKHSDFHLTMIKGLLALYLSDPKTEGCLLKETTKFLLDRAGLSTKFLYGTCKLLRRGRLIS